MQTPERRLDHWFAHKKRLGLGLSDFFKKVRTCLRGFIQCFITMDLFNQTPDPSRNLLPKDGIVQYFGRLFTTAVANEYYEKLMQNIEWKND